MPVRIYDSEDIVEAAFRVILKTDAESKAAIICR